MPASRSSARNNGGNSKKDTSDSTSASDAAASNNSTSPPTKNNTNASSASEEAIVLSYLRKYGLANAAMELQSILTKEKEELKVKEAAGKSISDGASDATAAAAGDGEDSKKRKRDEVDTAAKGGGAEGEGTNKKLPPIDYDVSEDMDEDDNNKASSSSTADVNNNETKPTTLETPNSNESKPPNTLANATGGGLGYDLDAAPAVALWGAGYAPPSLRNQHLSKFLLEGRSNDATNDEDAGLFTELGMNVRDEARRYIEGFTCLVTWILSLPDDPANVVGGGGGIGGNVEESSVLQGGDAGGSDEGEVKDDGKDDEMEIDGDTELDGKMKPTEHQPHEGLATLVKHSLAAASISKSTSGTVTLPLGATAAIPSAASFQHDLLLLPPSSKPELLSLSFPLLVHTYCELLACGLEHTARALLDTYRHLYPSHPNEISDLDKCNTTKTIVELNENVVQQSVVQSEIRLVHGQVGANQKKKIELENEMAMIQQMLKKGMTSSGNDDEKRRANLLEFQNTIAKINDNLSRLHSKLQELIAKNNLVVSKLSSFQFLRRARALKWNINISSASFGALTGFVASRDEMLPMSALLQSRCHLIVERRDPLPFCPPALLEDMDGSVKNDGKNGDDSVRWAAPTHPVVRAIEAGEDVQGSGVDGSEPHHKLARSILVHSEALPFPKYRLDEGEDGEKDAREAVEFNRALLVNGFRRLEALELKKEYESGVLGPDARGNRMADPLNPSVLMGSLCSSSEADVGAGAPWLESNIGITSASICLPDGRRVAVGCDDAAVRIWSLDRPTKTASANNPGTNSLGEPSMVLLGHKNGFPVFDVDWTRNGRTLLSAGGDGTCRLWDTEAVGPYGRLSNMSQQKSSSQSADKPASISLSSVHVPGFKAEPLVEIGGAALSVYRGHAPSTPIWAVSSAPSGYYFASAGSDYTARIWATDRCTPVRVLSGHISPSVNDVTWHPNCNYVVTASDDKTCRMWDIQTGKCVRLLSGSARGLNKVKVSPSGRYVAGAGYDNVVRIWDLGNGRLVNELRPDSSSPNQSFSDGTIHSLSFSACGAALAVAGEDLTVRIWDVRGAANHLSNPDYFAATRGATATSSISDGLTHTVTPSQVERMPANEGARPGTRVPTRAFKTNGISVLDLKYTKRNLLLAVGSYGF
jgi:WD40 repeat protein